MRAPAAGAADSRPSVRAMSRVEPPYHCAAMAGKSARGIPNTIAIRSW